DALPIWHLHAGREDKDVSICDFHTLHDAGQLVLIVPRHVEVMRDLERYVVENVVSLVSYVVDDQLCEWLDVRRQDHDLFRAHDLQAVDKGACAGHDWRWRIVVTGNPL